MNLRLSHKQLLFKITAEELEHLLDGEVLAQQMDLLDQGFNLRIEPGCTGNELTPVFDHAPEPGIRLTVPRALLEELQARGRDREGLSRQQGDTTVTLQVDLRSQGRA